MNPNPEAVAEAALAELRRRIPSGPLAWAARSLENVLRDCVVQAVREVAIAAPGVVIEDARQGGGAVIEDLR